MVFTLGVSRKGVTRRQQLEHARDSWLKLPPARRGLAPPGIEMLEHQEVPPEVDHVWEWFLDLHRSRTDSGYSHQPISAQEIKAWVELTQNVIRPHEVDMIRNLDAIYRDVQAEAAEEDRKMREAEASQKQALAGGRR